MIRENPEWEFAGLFADEAISGTSVFKRVQFLEMIEPIPQPLLEDDENFIIEKE